MKTMLELRLNWLEYKSRGLSYLLLFLLLPMLTGCSMLFVNAPPEDWEDSPDLQGLALTQPCTSSKALVGVDGILAVLHGAAALSYTNSYTNDEQLQELNNTIKSTHAWSAATLLVTAFEGNQKVEDCKRFNEAVLQQRAGNEKFSLLSSDWDEKNATIPWIESFGVSPLPKIPYRR